MNIKKARARPEHREERPDVDHIYMTRLGSGPIFIRPGGRSAAAPWWITDDDHEIRAKSS